MQCVCYHCFNLLIVKDTVVNLWHICIFGVIFSENHGVASCNVFAIQHHLSAITHKLETVKLWQQLTDLYI